MNELSKVDLATLAGGAAPELFQHELDKVLENIQDPNTEATAKRKVKLEVVIQPGEDRDHADVSLSVSAKLAPHKPATGPMYMGEKDGELVAVAYDPRQGDFFADEDQQKVTPIDREAHDAG